MALKLWRPLTKDLSNYGTLNEGSISRNTMVFTDGGKVGNKYATGVLTQHFITDFLENTWSIAIWVKKTDSFASTNQVIFAKNGSNASSNCQIYFSIANGNKLNIGVNGSTSSISYSYTFSLDTWYHVAATYNGSLLCLYINGVQVSTKTVTTAKKANALNVVLNARSSNAAGTSYTATGGFQLNDFRFYDNAISSGEVREISRGLVCHYKLDNINIIDSSLNNINGTTTGTLTTSTDSGRYSNSLVFSGSQRIETDSLSSEVKTVSVWAKTTWASVSSSNYQFIFHDTGAKLCMGFASAGLLTYVGSSNGGVGSYVATSGKYLANQWNHIVVIITGDTTRQVYINGQLATNNANNYFSGDLNKLLIGCRHSGGVYRHYFKGQLSDFRAYATELSEADVLELYQVGAKIYKNGNFYTYEAVENQPITKITKQGQVKVLEVNENNKISFDETGDLNTFELIEI